MFSFTVKKKFVDIDHIVFYDDGKYPSTFKFLALLCREFGLTLEQLHAIFVEHNVVTLDFDKFVSRVKNNAISDKEVLALSKMFNVDARDIINVQTFNYNKRRRTERYVTSRKERRPGYDSRSGQSH